MLTLFLGRYKAYVFAVVFALIAYLWLNVFISNGKKEAVDEYKQAVTEATIKQVTKDEGEVIAAYKQRDDIDDYVDSVYFDTAKASSGDRLQRIEEDSRAADGDEARASVGGEYKLSDQEINAIREYSEYLQ